MKSVIKWLLSGVIGVAMVVLILGLFTLVAKPGRAWFTDYLAKYYQDAPEYDVVAMTMEEEARLAMEEWATPVEDMPHCEFRITGQVKMNNGAPIENAEVKLHNVGMFNSGDYRYTDEEGKFTYSEFGIEICDKQSIYVSISKNGFEPFFIIAEPDQVIDVALSAYSSY
ncbi:MAG: hypothetical protein HKN08_13095 [Gammaproteobacteria bacterium]|nr:hypothetical protein [Gammaproteobacteria bacterium]